MSLELTHTELTPEQAVQILTTEETYAIVPFLWPIKEKAMQVGEVLKKMHVDCSSCALVTKARIRETMLHLLGKMVSSKRVVADKFAETEIALLSGWLSATLQQPGPWAIPVRWRDGTVGNVEL